MDDPVALAALVFENARGVCLDCVELKIGPRPEDIGTTLERLAAVVQLVTRYRRCSICSKLEMVVALGRSAFVRGDRVVSRTEATLVGEVVDTGRLRDGYVSVRWQRPGGSPPVVEERGEGLFLLPRSAATDRPSPEALARSLTRS